MRRHSVFAGSLILVLSLLSPPANALVQPEDNARIAGTILPPGTDWAHATAEIAPYDNLVYEYPALTEDTLFRYFKNAGFGPQGTIAREYSPRDGVRILRDERWGVPHVYGATDEDVWFGSGYVSAEDRLPIMDLLRALGRGEVFDLIASNTAWMADAEMMRLYGYTEEEFQEQIARLPKLYGAEGEEIVTAFREFIDGVNNYIARIHRGEVPLPTGYREIGRMPAPWRETDIVAVTTVIRALFGAGGGNELANAALFADLVDAHGPSDARAIYEDFRNRDNRDGPTHTSTVFPYMGRDAGALDPAASVVDYGSGTFGLQQTFENVAGMNGQFATAGELHDLADQAEINWDALNLTTPLGSIDLRPKGMSNALVIGKGLADPKKPMLLGGPQTGYFSPEILMEVDLHGPTIHTRGAAFPGISMFVLLGRSTDAAWTATAGGSDMIDIVIEELCEADGSQPTEHSYGTMLDGSCEPMNRRVHRTLPHVPGVNTRALPDIYVERTVHGVVIGRGTVSGMPVAAVRQRSSYGREVDSALPFLRLNRNEVLTGQDFRREMGKVNLTTNWLFAGQRDIAYMHGGLFPRRPATVDPDFPRWGNNPAWEWDGFLDWTEHPYAINPTTDYLTSWNNRPAPGWNSSDAKWAWSSLYRSGMLDEKIEADGSITPVELVQMMEEAGLTDMRGLHVLPQILRVIGTPAAGTQEAAMVSVLEDWIAAKALRRDSDQDGRYDHGSAVAIMDELWSRVIRAIYDPALGNVAAINGGFDNAPGSAGSAYQDGFYGQVWTDLSMVLGDTVLSPTSQTYCGSTAVGTNGTFADCRAALRQALTDAGQALESQHGTDDPSQWQADPEAERILFLPGAALSMHWVNRPTFQQLTQFAG